MYKKLIIIAGVLLLLTTSATASDDWWNTSYQYRIPITLTGNTSGSQTNYQLMLNISYNSNMQSDFDDIRFTDGSGNSQNAWLESKTDNSWADIWINFTSTPDNGATQTYYMYYGNTAVSNYWNGNTTFIQGIINNPSFETLISSDDWIFVDSGEGGTLSEQQTDWVTDKTYSIKIYEGYGSSISGTHTSYLHQDYSGAYAILIDIHTNQIESVDSQVSIECDSNEKWSSNISDTEYLNLDIPLSAENGTHTLYLRSFSGGGTSPRYAEWHIDNIKLHKYTLTSPSYTFGIEEEYTLPAASETPTPTPTSLEEITSSNYVIQNQTLYITKSCNLQYKITSNSFAYGGLRNINTVICDNNNTVISGWFKISTDQTYDADYTFLINVNDTSYESKIVTLKQERIDSSIISKTYKRSLLIDGYEIYSYNTTVYIVSILPNPIYFYFNLEDRTIQFGDKQFNNQTLVFNQLNFDDQYEFMNNASGDTVVMKFKAINPEQKSGAELKGLTGILLNALSKIPFIGKSFKNVLYYPLFFIQTIFDFVFTFLDMIVNDWWYGLMLMEIVCIFAASRNKGYANVMEVYIDTHVKIIKFIYEWIILKTINLIITIVVTIKDMIKWW